MLIDRVADFGVHDVFDEESEECVPVDPDALVSHDEPETGPGVDEDRDPTNFSLVHWADVAKALHLQVSTGSRNDPRFR